MFFMFDGMGSQHGGRRPGAGRKTIGSAKGRRAACLYVTDGEKAACKRFLEAARLYSSRGQEQAGRLTVAELLAT